MNRRIFFVLSLLVTSLSAIGCAAGDDPVDDPSADSADSALTTVGTGGTGGTGTISTERPKETHASCMSACKTTHISNGWCTAYCDCRIYYKGAPAACAEHASGMYIDI